MLGALVAGSPWLLLQVFRCSLYILVACGRSAGVGFVAVVFLAWVLVIVVPVRGAFLSCGPG